MDQIKNTDSTNEQNTSIISSNMVNKKDETSEDHNQIDGKAIFDNNQLTVNIANYTLRIVGNHENPYFCGKDLGNILRYKNYRKASGDHVNINDKFKLSYICKEEKINYSTYTHNELNTIYINKKGLITLLAETRKNINPLFLQFIKENFNIIFNITKRYTKEQETINDICRVFKHLQHITQYKVDTYFIDLYFPEFNIAIECDENGHKDRSQKREGERETYITDKLKCKFYRFNPDDKNFHILDVIHDLVLLLQ